MKTRDLATGTICLVIGIVIGKSLDRPAPEPPPSVSGHTPRPEPSPEPLEDPLAALETVSLADRQDAVNSAAETLADRDPEAALVWAESLTRPNERVAALRVAMEALAKRDPEAALAYFESAPDDAFRIPLAVALYTGWSEVDGPAAVIHLRGLGEPAVIGEVLDRVGVALGRAAPNEAEAFAFANPMMQSAQMLLFGAYAKLKGSDFPGVFDRLDSQLPQGELRAKTEDKLFEFWTALDPKGAGLRIAKLPPGEHSDYLTRDFARNLAYENPIAAIDWIRNLPTTNRSRDALQDAFDIWSQSDPEAASEGLLDVPPDSIDGASTAQAIFSNWAYHDPNAAYAATSNLSGETQRHARFAVFSILEGTDPAQAAKLFVSAFDELEDNSTLPETYRSVPSGIARGWGSIDPEAALEFAFAFPIESYRAGLVKSALHFSINRDPLGSSQLIAELPQGAIRDTAAARLVYSIRDLDPAAAVRWAESIESEDIRSEPLGTAYDYWGRHDLPAALSSLSESSMGDEAKDRILEFWDRYHSKPTP